MRHHPSELPHMATKNPRISVSLTPSLATLLNDLAVETGDSASSLVRGILVQTEPALGRMLQLVRAARDAQGQIGSGVGRSLQRAAETLEDALAVADARFGRAAGDLVSEAEAVRGRRRPTGSGGPAAARAAASDPRAVTRGSGVSQGRHKRGSAPGGRGR
jgi:hypothetical protein